MTTNEERLAGLEAQQIVLDRRDRRQMRAIVALLILLLAAFLVVGWLARSLDQRNQSVEALSVLVERQECTDEAEGAFEDALTAVVVGAVREDDVMLLAGADALEAQGSQADAIAACAERYPDP